MNRCHPAHGAQVRYGIHLIMYSKHNDLEGATKLISHLYGIHLHWYCIHYSKHNDEGAPQNLCWGRRQEPGLRVLSGSRDPCKLLNGYTEVRERIISGILRFGAALQMIVYDMVPDLLQVLYSPQWLTRKGVVQAAVLVL